MTADWKASLTSVTKQLFFCFWHFYKMWSWISQKCTLFAIHTKIIANIYFKPSSSVFSLSTHAGPRNTHEHFSTKRAITLANSQETFWYGSARSPSPAFRACVRPWKDAKFRGSGDRMVACAIFARSVLDLMRSEKFDRKCVLEVCLM